MKVNILRAVAEPATLFWAPMIPGIINMFGSAFVGVIYVKTVGGNPLIIFVLMMVGHGMIVAWGAKEPHLTNMIRPFFFAKTPTVNAIKSKGNKFIP
ncbi:MAG: hypothetical protein ACTSXQ_00885 [Alphaproteobacteria bacterium]